MQNSIISKFWQKKLQMRNREIYEYAIVRILPKVERGEFLNVGLILFSKRKKYLDIKYHIDKKRLLAFSDEIDIDQLENYLKAWKLVCDGKKEGGAIGALEMHVRFRWLTASRSTIIQSSEVHPGLLCTTPEETLNTLFNKYVL